MLFKIGDKVFSGDDIPCGIVFWNDDEREAIINLLQQMRPSEGNRWFCATPKGFSPEEFMKWAELNEEEAKKMTVVRASTLIFNAE